MKTTPFPNIMHVTDIQKHIEILPKNNGSWRQDSIKFCVLSEAKSTLSNIEKQIRACEIFIISCTDPVRNQKFSIMYDSSEAGLALFWTNFMSDRKKFNLEFSFEFKIEVQQYGQISIELLIATAIKLAPKNSVFFEFVKEFSLDSLI